MSVIKGRDMAKQEQPKPLLSDEEIVADMVKRFKKWDARGTPLVITMNKILVNIKTALL